MDTLNIGLLTANLNNGNMGCNALGYSAICLLESLSKLIGIPFSYSLISDDNSDSLVLYPDLGNTNILTIPPRLSFRSKVKALLYKDWSSIKSFSADFKKCDLFFEIAGGDSFSDIYGTKRLQKEYSFHKKAKRQKKPLIFAPQTIGPFKSKKAKRIAADSLSYAEHIFVRDPLSYQKACEYVDHTKISQSIDMAFFMDYAKREKNNSRLQVGINPSGLLWGGGYTGNNQFGLKCDYKKLLSSIISSLVSKQIDVTLISHVLHGPVYHIEDDFKICLWLKNKFPLCNMAPFFYTPVEAKSFISGLDLLIGSRMHCCIAAYSSGVPIYPLSYSRKFKGLFKEELKYPYGAELVESEVEEILIDLENVFNDIITIQSEMPDRLKRLSLYKDRFLSEFKQIILSHIK